MRALGPAPRSGERATRRRPSARPSSRPSPASRSSRSIRTRTSAPTLEERVGYPGRLPVHPRALSLDVPGAAVDDAPVRRLRHGRGDQRALPLPARPRPDRALDGLRHADPDGLRLRPRRAASARSAARGSPSTPSPTWKSSSPGSRSAAVTTSMTINAPAAILLAFYVLVGERQGVPAEKLGGTIQTDILKEYIAQKEWCFPIEPALRLITDMIEWCTENMPRWHPISISGYHIREAGSTAAAGARLHPQGRLHLRRAGDRARARRRRLRAPPLLLLQLPHRLLRGDRQVPGGAPDLGAGDARHLRREARRSRCGCASTPRPPASP